jgi:ABC-type microcin C transport system permease subunit YejB
MLGFLARRLCTVVPTLVLVSMLIFSLQQLLPGDPAKILAGEEQDPTVIAYLHQKLHLDEPLPVRYAYWIGGAARRPRRIGAQPAGGAGLVLQKLPVTVELALLAMGIALVIGIPAAWPPQWAAALPGTSAPTRCALGPLDAELLARHPDDPAVLGQLGWLRPRATSARSRTWAPTSRR